jgi:hypothetical protein
MCSNVPIPLPLCATPQRPESNRQSATTMVMDGTTGNKKKRQPRPAGVKQQKTTKVSETNTARSRRFPSPTTTSVPFLSAFMFVSSPFPPAPP